MRWLVLSKIAFWMIVIGTVALVTPNPAWPREVAQAVLASGFLLGLVGLGSGLWRARRAGRDAGGKPNS